MNPPHTYAIYTSQSVNIFNCSYLKTFHFLCWGLSSALNAFDLVGLSGVVKNLLLG